MYYSFYDYDLEFEDGNLRILGYDPDANLVKVSKMVMTSCCAEYEYFDEQLHPMNFLAK